MSDKEESRCRFSSDTRRSELYLKGAANSPTSLRVYSRVKAFLWHRLTFAAVTFDDSFTAAVLCCFLWFLDVSDKLPRADLPPAAASHFLSVAVFSNSHCVCPKQWHYEQKTFLVQVHIQLIRQCPRCRPVSCSAEPTVSLSKSLQIVTDTWRWKLFLGSQSSGPSSSVTAL